MKNKNIMAFMPFSTSCSSIRIIQQQQKRAEKGKKEKKKVAMNRSDMKLSNANISASERMTSSYFIAIDIKMYGNIKEVSYQLTQNG